MRKDKTRTFNKSEVGKIVARLFSSWKCKPNNRIFSGNSGSSIAGTAFLHPQRTRCAGC